MVTKFDGYTLLDVQYALHNVYKCVEKVKHTIETLIADLDELVSELKKDKEGRPHHNQWNNR